MKKFIQLATQGATFTAGERLAQELQMIEAGIREKEKDVRNWSPYGTVPWIPSSNNLLNSQNFNQDYKLEEVSYNVVILYTKRTLSIIYIKHFLNCKNDV